MKIYKPELKHTIFLHSNKATTTTASGGKITSFSWNISPFTIDELAEFQIGSIASLNASSSNIYTFRLQTPMAYSSTNYCSDSGIPIIFSLVLNNTNSTFRDDYGIILSAQAINNITITVSDDYTNPNSGIDPSVAFVMCIVIQEFQYVLQEIGNPMADAIQEVKGRVANNFRIH